MKFLDGYEIEENDETCDADQARSYADSFSNPRTRSRGSVEDIENFTNLRGVMYQEGFNRTISVQSILLPRHSFMKGISVVFGIGDEKQHLKIRLLTIKTKIRVQSLSCNLYANCDRCSSVGVVAISKIFGKASSLDK
ncbi:hypothetical protein Avbf_07093 [Armadillidium vulgare]|nr:hypothetical protein Avbf_07093 [Armadillidium vulgare]